MEEGHVVKDKKDDLNSETVLKMNPFKLPSFSVEKHLVRV